MANRPQDVVGLVAKAAEPHRLNQGPDTTWYVVINGQRWELGRTPRTATEAYVFIWQARRCGIDC